MAVKKAPLDIFQKTVKYFPTFAVNVILLNRRREFLLVKRKNHPAKGLYYLPGGRILNGESVIQCGKRVLREELGIKGDIKYVSSKYAEEIWPTKYFGNDFSPYSKDTKNVHYLSTIVVAELKKEDEIRLDYQAEKFNWFKQLPKKPPLLNSCFVLVSDYLKKVYHIDLG